MKKIAAISLIWVLFSSLSCSHPDEFLELDVSGHKSYLINALAYNCSLTVIPAKYFTVRNLKFIWKHAYNRLSIAAVNLKFSNSGLSGGGFSCVIGGDELHNIVSGW